jgi:hypothetical protein
MARGLLAVLLLRCYTEEELDIGEGVAERKTSIDRLLGRRPVRGSSLISTAKLARCSVLFGFGWRRSMLRGMQCYSEST